MQVNPRAEYMRRYASEHREQLLEYKRRWYISNKVKIAAQKREYQRKTRKERNAYSRAYNSRIRDRLIEEFGARCQRCGFDDRRALQFDHVNGGGRRERATRGNSAWRMAKVIEGNRTGFQLLCANCNWIKRHENGEYGRKD